jgi:hypothetical protein
MCNNVTTTVGNRHVKCVFFEACPSCVYISEQNFEAEAVSWRSEQKAAEARKQAVSLRSMEEYKKSACEDLTCDLKTLYAL